jgi:hypothetical protein
MKISSDNIFDVVAAVYWYLTDNHFGQWSDEYLALCSMEYSPGMMEKGPPTEESQEIYLNLTSKKAIKLAAKIKKYLDEEY